jgi:hypothetical protein
MVRLLVWVLLLLASCDTSQNLGLVVTTPAEAEESVRMVVPFSGRSTANMVRVPVGDGSVTVFAAVFRSAPNRGLRSRPAASVTQASRWPRGLSGSGINITPFTTGHFPWLAIARSFLRLSFHANRLASTTAKSPGDLMGQR